MSDLPVVGLGAGIVNDDRLVWSGGYGMADLDERRLAGDSARRRGMRSRSRPAGVDGGADGANVGGRRAAASPDNLQARVEQRRDPPRGRLRCLGVPRGASLETGSPASAWTAIGSRECSRKAWAISTIISKPHPQLARGEVVVGDGAWGTQLMERGLPSGRPPEVFNLDLAAGQPLQDAGHRRATSDSSIASAIVPSADVKTGNTCRCGLRHFSVLTNSCRSSVDVVRVKRVRSGTIRSSGGHVPFQPFGTSSSQ
jgi:hypothetical protein